MFHYCLKIFIQIVFLSCLLLACQNAKQPETSSNNAPDTLEAFVLQKQAIQRSLQLPAELLPLEKAEIFAKVQGYIRQIKVDIGDQVSQGQVLALIDAPEITANLNQVQAKLGEIQAKYRYSQDYYQRLFKASQVKGTISSSELNQAFSQMQADSSAVQTSRANISAYLQMNNYLAIVAPFSGIITQRNADVGNLVNTNNPKPILVLENMSQLRLRVAVPEIYTLTAPQSKEVKFQTQAQPDKSYIATFSRQSGSIDPTTRTETWEFRYANPTKQLKAGMYVNLTLDLGRNENAFAVPNSAIISNLEKKFVIAQRQGKAIHIPIKTGFKMTDKTEIFGELQEGEILLLKPNDEIKNEQSIISKKAKI